MAVARSRHFQVPAETRTVRLGRQEPTIFDSLSFEDKLYPATAAQMQGKPLILKLHASGGAANTLTTGRVYTAGVSGPMAYQEYDEFKFSTVGATAIEMTASGGASYVVRPADSYGTFPGGTGGKLRESFWYGFQHIPGEDVKLIAERRLDGLMEWAKGYFKHDPKRVYVMGGSMGARGCLTYGLRRPHMFPALYVDRARWFHHAGDKNVLIPDWTNDFVTVPSDQSPLVAEEDGGGTLFDRVNPIQYLLNPANKAPWIGWCVGRLDNTIPWAGNLEAVNVLRATGRGFAFYWNNGDHGATNLAKLLQSYKIGDFVLGQGYPLFTEHSEDDDPFDPAVLEGGINIGLAFKEVVESPTGWSCKVTSVLGPCTVKVKPISDVFTASVASTIVSIPAANTWVPVNF